MENKGKNSFIRVVTIIIFVLVVIFGTNFTDDLSSIYDTAVEGIEKIKEEKDNLEKISGNLEVHYIDVGQADSILITSDSANMLIDAGNEEDGEMIVSYLENLGIEQLDYVVATHAHEDHIGGMDDVLKSFYVKEFFMPDVLATSRCFENLLDTLEMKNLEYETPEVEDILEFGDGAIEIIYVGDDENDLNDTSIILKLTYGKTSFLFTGDATSKVEEKIFDMDIEADVLKVAHHGSNYSTSNSFLEKVNPSYAIISVGKDNTYKHPSIETIDKLNKKGVKTYRTDEKGTIIITSDGNSLSFSLEKN